MARLGHLSGAAALAVFLLGAVLGGALAGAAAQNDPNQSGSGQSGRPMVNCFEESLGTVHRVFAGDCPGRVVSDDEAEAIQQKRRDYIRRALARPDPRVEGKQLAGLGSGFFVAEDGTVITNNHVVDGCAVVSVTPAFGEMQLARSVDADPAVDLALLRTGIAPPGVAGLLGSEPPIGAAAYAIGYPERGLVTIEPVVTPVEVLGRRNDAPTGTAIVLRGDVRRGNSGGPLLDSGGDVVGVLYAKVDSVGLYQATGQLVRDIGLALPAGALQAFLAERGVDFRHAQGRPPQPVDRILEQARAFLVQVGCWR